MNNNRQQQPTKSKYKGYLSNAKTLPCVFNALKGTQITVQLRNESEIYGTVDNIDKSLNIELRDATITKGYDYRLLFESNTLNDTIHQIDINKEKEKQDRDDKEEEEEENIIEEEEEQEQEMNEEEEEEEEDEKMDTTTTSTTNNETNKTISVTSTLILTKEVIESIKLQPKVYDLLLVNSRNIRYIHIPDRIDLNHLLFVYSKTLVKNRDKYQRTKRKPPTEKAMPSVYVHDDGSTLIQQQTDYKKVDKKL
ncbi:hypothetical protein DFA_00406 [Cavenderia fasciculata]|uniref:Sm domain-containing protein n=1 Tax=Cavenderia fasciculata TaxID=261658 RepID=F4PRP6_CACFS|nr:uncharacterized protein DFA_00406 [Cavenderia fasciculata]EGG20545.1 hypothetical protein DFA_00406 [Cavenderia fasciculata]|eukprot:XP_004358395.1 hypothetical protein DFA_00406 [Cavenderia fasciculata]